MASSRSDSAYLPARMVIKARWLCARTSSLALPAAVAREVAASSGGEPGVDVAELGPVPGHADQDGGCQRVGVGGRFRSVATGAAPGRAVAARAADARCSARRRPGCAARPGRRFGRPRPASAQSSIDGVTTAARPVPAGGWSTNWARPRGTFSNTNRPSASARRRRRVADAAQLDRHAAAGRHPAVDPDAFGRQVRDRDHGRQARAGEGDRLHVSWLRRPVRRQVRRSAAGRRSRRAAPRSVIPNWIRSTSPSGTGSSAW